MSYIKLNDPNEVAHYSYPIQPMKLPNQKERLMTALEIGNKIKPEYENGSKMTPARMQRLAAITVAALSAIAAVAAVTAACVTQIYPLAAIAIPFVGLGVASGIFAIYRRKDMDSPKYRAEAQEKIKDFALEKLSKKYDVHTVVGYRLLDGTPAASKSDEEQEVIFYTKYKKLVKELNLLENWRNGEVQRVNHIWADETRVLRNWYSDQMQIIGQGQAIRHQSTAHLHSNIRYREAVTGRRENGLRTVNTIANGFNFAADIADCYEEREISRMYGSKIAPWDRWLEEENTNINIAFERALNELEMQFIEMKLRP